MAEQDGAGFDPGKHLTKVGGSEYLEVKWRLVWLRQRHPDAEIETDMKVFEPDEAVFKATIRLPNGGSATGWGSESAGDFRDYLEKAETKAIGRALAALGFGTQFAPDHEFGATSSPPRVVDAPVDFATTRGRRMAAAEDGGGARPGSGPNAVTPKQMRFLQAIAREAGYDEDSLNLHSDRTYGTRVSGLTSKQASALIEWLQAERGKAADEPAGQPALIAVDPRDLLARIERATTGGEIEALHADLVAAKADREVWDAYGRKAKAISSAS